MNDHIKNKHHYQKKKEVITSRKNGGKNCCNSTGCKERKWSKEEDNEGKKLLIGMIWNETANGSLSNEGKFKGCPKKKKKYGNLEVDPARVHATRLSLGRPMSRLILRPSRPSFCEWKMLQIQWDGYKRYNNSLLCSRMWYGENSVILI